MDNSDFSTLIGRLEREADGQPQLYLAKVAAAAALGYLGPGLIALRCSPAVSDPIALASGGTPSIPRVDLHSRRRRGADRDDTGAASPGC